MPYPHPNARVNDNQKGERMRPDQPGVEQLLEKLRLIVEQISETGKEGLSPRLTKSVQTGMVEITDKLLKIAREFDPIRQPDVVFDPGNPSLVGRFVALALLAQPRRLLSSISNFYGAGVYSLYYMGNFEPYKPLSGNEHPIYVGKVDPLDAMAKTPTEQGKKLTDRLNEHRKNIEKAQNDVSATLILADFECRFLVVQSGLQTAAENYLINLYKPIWNSETGICYGLGKHGDDATTRANQRSPWDTMHPGRAWAAKSIKDAKSVKVIRHEIKEHFDKNPPIKTIDKVFKHFIDEMRQS
jgi:hypothetical protein